MMHQSQQNLLLTSQLSQGILLGVVLDLSGSMSESIKNNEGYQVSKIESLSKVFQQVLDDMKEYVSNTPAQELTSLRLFIHGFGFQTTNFSTEKDRIGDIFSILAAVEQQLEEYKSLGTEIREIWLTAIEQLLENQKMKEDAKEQLRSFVEGELQEKAVQAENQRNAAKFQSWCEATCQKLDDYGQQMRRQSVKYQGLAKLFLFPIIGCFWLLHGPTFLLTKINAAFEAVLQKRRIELRDNASKYASQQSEKVAEIANKTVDEHFRDVQNIIEKHIINFIDLEAFRFIHSFKNRSSLKTRTKLFNYQGLYDIYGTIEVEISNIMSPNAQFTWEKSIFVFKQAAKVLKIRPDWDLLQEKTLTCARQIVWERIALNVRNQAELLVKERFTRAILMTIAQETKKRETTLTMAEVFDLIKLQKGLSFSLRELPIFSGSPLGTALKQTFIRLQKEKRFQPNSSLHPAILIISDGMPTDAHLINTVSLAEQIKAAGIPVVCCFVTNHNINKPWKLRQKPGWRWSEAARLMFSAASSVEEWPEFTQKLMQSRFSAKSHAKLFMQLNHTEHLRSFVEAILLPIQRE